MMTTTTAPLPRATRYTSVAVLLHWTIALLLVIQLIGGYAMSDLLAEGTRLQFDAYQLHKSFGITVLLLTVARIVWRLFNPPPAEPASVSRLEALAAGIVQFAFYALLIIIPLTGWVVVSAGTVDIATVLFFVDALPIPDLPFFGGLSEAARHSIAERGEAAHAFLAYATLALIALHVAGAVKHQREDGVFIARMGLKGGPARRAHGRRATLIVTLGLFAILVGSATIARNTGSATAPAPATASAPEAAAPASPASAGADANAAAWTLDKAASTLGYTARHAGAEVKGGFNDFDADIVFDPEDLENARIAVTIDTTSAFINSSEISLQNVSGADGFDNANYGTARFTADTIRAEGEGYVADGVLEIRGKSLPQTLYFTLTIDGDTAEANGTLTLARLDYGIGASNDASGTFLGPEVTVDVAVSAHRTAP